MSPRKRQPDPWPWPGDTQTERARRIARSYRDALNARDPDECTVLDQRATDLGQGWIVPKVQTVELDDLLTAELAADFAGVRVRTIDMWRSRGLAVIRTPDGPRYRPRDILDYQAERRKRRIA